MNAATHLHDDRILGLTCVDNCGLQIGDSLKRRSDRLLTDLETVIFARDFGTELLVPHFVETAVRITLNHCCCRLGPNFIHEVVSNVLVGGIKVEVVGHLKEGADSLGSEACHSE